MWIFGGFDGHTRLNDMWSLSLTGPLKYWLEVKQIGECPPPCCNFALVVHSDSKILYSSTKCKWRIKINFIQICIYSLVNRVQKAQILCFNSILSARHGRKFAKNIYWGGHHQPQFVGKLIQTGEDRCYSLAEKLNLSYHISCLLSKFKTVTYNLSQFFLQW